MNESLRLAVNALFTQPEQEEYKEGPSGVFVGAQVEAAINAGIPIPYPPNKLAERQKTFLAMQDGYQPGAIISSSWGYDQTNIDFYRIEKRSGEWVTLLPMRNLITEDGFMSGRTIPFDQPKDPHTDHDVAWRNKESAIKNSTFRKKIRFREGKPTGFTIQYGWARLWDAEPERCSWYA